MSPDLRRSLVQEARHSDIMHNHGLWIVGNLYPAWAVEGTRCRLVTSPRGTLSPVALSRSRWIKKLAWWTCQSRVAREAACLHATSESEYEQIRARGLRNPVAIVPNGVDIPEPPPPSSVQRAEPRRLLFLGRIHPIKGLDVLLKAWRNVQRKYPEWELRIVGPDDRGQLKKVQALDRSLGCERTRFDGPRYGREKSEAYDSADLFVLPSRSENFGMAVAEALAHGVPCIVGKGAPWSGLESHGCGWWVEPSEGQLSECLQEALSLPQNELRRRGARGRAWMEQEFSWSHIGSMMSETYTWVLGGGNPPDWVLT